MSKETTMGRIVNSFQHKLDTVLFTLPKFIK